MKTKIFTLLFVIVASFGTVFAAGTKINGLYYILDSKNKTAQVTFERYQDAGSTRTYYGPDVTEANIPDEVNGYKVTSIGYHAFSNCKNLKSVSMGKYITSIGEGAFKNCSALTTISIPENVSAISQYAFDGCISLPEENGLRYADTYLQGATDYTKETYTIKDGTRWIGSHAFYYRRRLKSLILPESVIAIGDAAFMSCDSLSSITIPNNVNLIGNLAFEDCKGLKSLTMGNGIRRVGWNAFDGCDSLTAIYISDLAAWCSIEFDSELLLTSNPIANGGALYLNGKLLTDIEIPNTITRIGEGVFSAYKKMSSIKIPNSITIIGKNAFCKCPISTLRLPSSVTFIGESAFAKCSYLESLMIPNSVDTIGDYAFNQCDSLKSVIIGKSCQYVGTAAFSSCKKVHSCVIGKNVKSMHIGFDKCYDLTSINCLFDYPYPIEEVSIYLEGGNELDRPCLYVPTSASIAMFENTNPYRNYYVLGKLHIRYISDLEKIETTKIMATLEPDGNVVSSQQIVTLSWPEVESAAWYIHEIKKDGVIVDAFISNDDGQQLCGDFRGYGVESSCHYVSSVNLTGKGWISGRKLKNGETYTYTVTAMYDPQTVLYVKSVEITTPPTAFEVSFYNWNGDLLQRTYVEEGKVPTYTGDTPTRPDDDENTYVFKGWDHEIVAATWDTDNHYYATYEIKPIGEGLDDISSAYTPSKVLYNGQIFILRGDKTYTLQGQEVK